MIFNKKESTSNSNMLFMSIFISTSTAVYRYKLHPRKKGNEIRFCHRHLFWTTLQDRVLQFSILPVQPFLHEALPKFSTKKKYTLEKMKKSSYTSSIFIFHFTQVH